MSEWWEDEEPITEEETAWAEAYWETLAVGDPEPSSEGFDQRRLERIRAALDGEWRRRVRRITHHRT